MKADCGNGPRSELLAQLAEAVQSIRLPHPVRVAIDGPPAAGKTTLADELAVVLRAKGREVIRASIDDYLYPTSQRYRRGVYSGESCYEDSFDYPSLFRVLLDPLGPGGDRRIRLAAHDRRTDVTTFRTGATAPADAVLIFEGVFLLRPELVERWDLSVFVSAEFEELLDRARTRDLARYGSVAEVERRFRDRLIPAQKLYFEIARPTCRANIIVYNDDPQQPAWAARTL